MPSWLWRWSVFFSMFLGWSCHMLIRKNFPSTMTSLIQHQGFSRADMGKISSSFSLSYGLSKFLGSIASDHASPQRVFSLGLILAGACSLIFPHAHTTTLACAVWFAEGMTQGCGWPPCVILLKSWFPPSQMGRWWSVLSSAGNIVSAILPFLVIFITSVSHWSMSYYVFGVCGMGVGVLVMFTIKDSPEEVGMMSFHKTARKSRKEDNLENGAVGSHGNWYDVFFIHNLWIVSAVYSILYLVSSCAFNWSQLFFIQEAGMSETRAAACYSMYQVGAVVGNVTSGYLSDLFITPKTSKCPCPRSPLLLIISAMLVIVMHLFRTTVGTASSEGWVSALMFVLGFLVYSGVAVTGLSSMEVVPKHMVGSAHGLACAVAQVGAFVAGWPFTLVLDRHDWNTAYGGVELCLVLMVAISSYLVFLLVRARSRLKLS